jgi:predicted RNA-binding Zn ribbon-like protein
VQEGYHSRHDAPPRARRHALFLLLGEPLALDLVNTLVPPPYGGNLVATPDRVVEWLQAEADRLPADTLEPPEVPDLVALLAEIARSGIELLGGPDRDKLRRCEGAGCTLLLVASHPRRRWCAPHLCGNRVRVARHYRRRRGDGAA